MDKRELERRAEIARRLKAARWIAGSTQPKTDGKGKIPHEVAALSPADLASRHPLPENGITATLIGAIERMERPTKPMELAALAEALGMPREWFPTRAAGASSSLTPESLRGLLERALAEVDRVDSQAPRETKTALGGTGRGETGAGGAGG